MHSHSCTPDAVNAVTWQPGELTQTDTATDYYTRGRHAPRVMTSNSMNLSGTAGHLSTPYNEQNPIHTILWVPIIIFSLEIQSFLMGCCARWNPAHYTYITSLFPAHAALPACDSVSLLSSFWGPVNHTSTSAGLFGPVSWIRRTTPNGREDVEIPLKCSMDYTCTIMESLFGPCIHAKHLNLMAACSQDCSEWLSRWLMSCYTASVFYCLDNECKL